MSEQVKRVNKYNDSEGEIKNVVSQETCIGYKSPTTLLLIMSSAKMSTNFYKSHSLNSWFLGSSENFQLLKNHVLKLTLIAW
jgi:hypothetical protein